MSKEAIEMIRKMDMEQVENQSSESSQLHEQGSH